MTVLAVLLIVLPWSIWRQMHARPVTVEGLVKLPLIFGAAAAITTLTSTLHQVTTAEVVYNAGLCGPGNRATLTTWVVLIALKIALGTVAAVTGWIPAEGAGAILGFLALTFAIQNVVVARRTLWPPRTSIGATASRP